MSELSSSTTLCPHLVQKYVPLPGFSPVVGIKPPFLRIVKDMAIIYQFGVLKHLKVKEVYEEYISRQKH